jgi:hypothetical protein
MSVGKSKSISRRGFVTTSATALAGLTIVPANAVSGSGHIVPSDKLNVAAVGIGGKGNSDIAAVAKTENIVALCDVDWNEAVEKVFNTYPTAKDIKISASCLTNKRTLMQLLLPHPIIHMLSYHLRL